MGFLNVTFVVLILSLMFSILLRHIDQGDSDVITTVSQPTTRGRTTSTTRRTTATTPLLTSASSVPSTTVETSTTSTTTAVMVGATKSQVTAGTEPSQVTSTATTTPDLTTPADTIQGNLIYWHGRQPNCSSCMKFVLSLAGANIVWYNFPTLTNNRHFELQLHFKVCFN